MHAFRCHPFFRLGLFLILFATTHSSVIVQGASRPNVIVMITDDQGYGDFGFQGNPILRTPNLDAMARQSAQMTQYYVSPVCAPTRACLMTGRYNYRTRCIDTYIGRAMMDPEERTLAEYLFDAGYATGIFGKWHLGDNYPLRAMDQGFEESLVLRGGGIGQPSDPLGAEGKYTDPTLFHNGTPLSMKGYCTDLYFDHALSFMQQAKARNRPFFVYLPTNAPHGPFHDVPQAEYDFYRSQNLANDQFPQKHGHPLPENADLDKRARIFAMIDNIDQNVGKLTRGLEDLGVLENTLILFMVDNGPNGRRYVAGMQGMKSHVHEGGIRSPLLLHWPAHLKAGISSDKVVAHIDVTPTILDACGIRFPEGPKMDGRSFLPLLDGRPSVWLDRTLFIQSHRGDVPVRYHHFAARNQRWKLLHASGFGKEGFQGAPRLELYDMQLDPLETREVSRFFPEVVKEMTVAYDRWFDDVAATRPNNYAPPKIVIGSMEENPTWLTRQDWRHLQGKPWGANSNGHWSVRLTRPGFYRVIVHTKEARKATAVRMTLGDASWDDFQPNQAGQLEKEIQVALPTEGELQVELQLEDENVGPHQLEIHYRPSSKKP